MALTLRVCVLNFRYYPFPRSWKEDTEVNDGNTASDNPVVCEAEDSFTCSVALDTTANFVTMVTVSISDAVAPPVLFRIPARPGKSLVLCF